MIAIKYNIVSSNIAAVGRSYYYLASSYNSSYYIATINTINSSDLLATPIRIAIY